MNWHLLGTESKGKATLSGLTLTQDMLDLVRISPLQWGKFSLSVNLDLIHLTTLYNFNRCEFPEVTINDTLFKAQDEVTCNLGECVNVGVAVSNALENPLKNLMLSINLYQDHHNGVNNYRLDTRVSIAGANKVLLPTVSYFYLHKK